MGTRPLYTVCCKTSLDHPHAYGDKVCENYYAGDGVGSSPRVWGQDLTSCRIKCPLRIIPTRMGTRVDASTAKQIDEDHPHAYGDKAPSATVRLADVGSSPRVWGQAALACLKTASARIIPTRMGTSCRHSVRVYAYRDHPHAYGDKQLRATPYTRLRGSSPRVWGQVIEG